MTVAVALVMAGCTQAPPPPAGTTTTTDTSLPAGVTKTKKGLKGKMTNEVRKRTGAVGLD
jgi:hypothetical protein